MVDERHDATDADDSGTPGDDSGTTGGSGTIREVVAVDEHGTAYETVAKVDSADEVDPWVSRVSSYKPLAGSATIRRWTIIGAILGIVFIGGGFGFATYAFGGDVPSAIAIGLMTALFGGIGFGGMMGFVVQYARYNEHDIG